MLNAPRSLRSGEIDRLLARDVVARLATVDAHGFPHVTPLWFLWAGGAFWMTSLPDRPHLRRLEHNPNAGICVDVELPEREDGERPNQQVRAVGHAKILNDIDGDWTRRITAKYLRGAAAATHIEKRSSGPRCAIQLTPHRLLAVASF